MPASARTGGAGANDIIAGGRANWTFVAAMAPGVGVRAGDGTGLADAEEAGRDVESCSNGCGDVPADEDHGSEDLDGVPTG